MESDKHHLARTFSNDPREDALVQGMNARLQGFYLNMIAARREIEDTTPLKRVSIFTTNDATVVTPVSPEEKASYDAMHAFQQEALKENLSDSEDA